MSYLNGPRIITDNLSILLDPSNYKSYAGTGSTWSDISNNNRHATLINSPTFSSNVFTFNGTTQYATINYSADNFINTNFTWCLWVKGIGVGNTNMPKIGYGSGAWPRLGFRITSSTWYFSQYSNSGPPNTTDLSIGAESSTSWLYLCATADYTNTSLRTYRNGQLFATSATYRDTSGNGGLLGLARSGSTAWPDGMLSGSIGNFSVYNRVLTPDEILQNFNSLKGRFNL